MTHINQYAMGLDKNAANYVPLSPLSCLARSALVYPDRFSVVYNGRRFTWAQTYERCRRLASALAARGVGIGDTVAVMLPNVPAMYEAHFGVPMTGAVINTLNTRLDAEAIAFMLRHGEAKVLLTDREFSPVIEKALAMLAAKRPLVIEVDDPSYRDGKVLGEIEYEAFIEGGNPNFAWSLPDDEWNAIALSAPGSRAGAACRVTWRPAACPRSSPALPASRASATSCAARRRRLPEHPPRPRQWARGRSRRSPWRPSDLRARVPRPG